jgi:uncharacterized protein YndB with AHSA1/START domain
VSFSEDDVFKALADVSRRTLLDALHERDGQTLTELQSRLPLSRFGCMKHLGILEEAGLIATKKVGREKFHYLNPVPIQFIYDRWVGKFARPWANALGGLKAVAEEPLTDDTAGRKPAHLQQLVIRATPERVWRTLTDGDLTARYYFNARVESDWTVGAAYRYVTPDGSILVEGEVREADPPRRLALTFLPTFAARDHADLAPSFVTYDLEPTPEGCRLTVSHYDLDPAHPLTAELIEGWGHILAGLKTTAEANSNR